VGSNPTLSAFNSLFSYAYGLNLNLPTNLLSKLLSIALTTIQGTSCVCVGTNNQSHGVPKRFEI
jgi:hypothetical protein